MLSAICAILLYLVSILFIMPMLLKAQAGERVKSINKTLFFSTALLALLAHLISVFPTVRHIFTGDDFTFIQIGSLISVIIALLLTLATLFKVKTTWFILPVVYCLAVINLIQTTFIPAHVMHNLMQDTGLMLHVFLALFAYAVCFIATLYSIQLAWLHYNLKHKKTAISTIVPPLMLVERHFYYVLLTGEALLTLTLISGAIYLADFFAAQNIQKAVFSFLAWLVFGLFIIGHKKFCWRGKIMIIYTISGMILLTIAYFGSRALLEIH
ncbi:cytochrome c biogenesis protein CcsA [Pasteurellaceae bacterium LIM206]|nr:cytochrome c biogenesis protein CcsA [Pasteurellaceae bacterium LIM206]